MNRDSARQQIRDTFQNSFKKERFVYFTKNLLNSIDETKAFHARGYVPESFKNFIKTYERIGTYTDPRNKRIDAVIVYLKKESTLERARTAQRNFIANYLRERGEKDAGLIAFVSPNHKDWRFSFVKMEYKLTETPKGSVKAKEEFTPARRYSFIVGEHESSHTAQSRLVPILEDDRNNPTLELLEDAFSIEKVTKEFFEKYRELFSTAKVSLDEIVRKDVEIARDFNEKGIDTVNFAKKLLGQIVFLYFLQKKGWFGVKRHEVWGTGSKNFLRELFEKRHGDYKNFFNDILEPLFYNTLAIERPKDYSDRFDCKIPFLNGGLFDPINDYDWVDTDILMPNELFSNTEKTGEGDIGTGILDVFDRYNFTVKEDEPLEKEVAVDPEMLGKVFENLLEVKDRKSKGTYYTPRDIVHYMCQESLINYLYLELNSSTGFAEAQMSQSKLFGKGDPEQTKLRVHQTEIVSKEDIETLIKYGETAVEHDALYIEKLAENPEYKGKYDKAKLPQSVEKNAQLIDEKLATIRICDPAVGSGAFLVGMMSEVIRTRNALTSHIKGKKSRTIYDFKRHAIQNCLYGVDIDSGAVEIAKLRLWLSLVVDEEDLKQIKPLPNLDYRIVSGNSLLGVERTLENLRLFSRLEQVKLLYFDETNVRKKGDYKNQINELIREITNGHKEFDFEVYFSEVFHDKNGFDVIIANPPYVEHKKLKEFSSGFKKNYKTYSGTTDLYVYFYEKALNLLRDNGVLTFISSNKFVKTRYGAKLRRLLATSGLQQIIDFTKIHIFNALVASCIIVLLKRQNRSKVLVTFADDTIADATLSDFVRKNSLEIDSDKLGEDIWQLEDDRKLNLKSKIESVSKKLSYFGGVNIYRGITTGYNKAFVIDKLTRSRLIKEDSRNNQIIRPLLQGRNIKKWIYRESSEFLLFIPWHFPLSNNTVSGASEKAELEFKKKFPAIYKHLLPFKEELQSRNKEETGKRYEWYALQRCAASYYYEFEKEKLIWGLTADKWAFAYDSKGHYLPSNGYILTSSDISIKYLLALLNSNLIKFYFRFVGIMTAGGAFTLKHETIAELPIKEISTKDQQPVVHLVDKILSTTKENGYLDNPSKQALVKEYEKNIDQMVYKLYCLTEEEISIVEGTD